MGPSADLLFREQANLYRLQRQIDDMVSGASAGGSAFDLTEAVIKGLHKIAMAGLLDAPGEYRQIPVRINNSPHQPPNWLEVPALMGTLCRYMQLEWARKDMVHLAAFILWRLNWIHPFANGNGRTARAVCYLTLCAKYGQLLPAKNTVTQQIIANRGAYYSALRATDTLYEQDQNNLDAALKPLADWIGFLLKEQLKASLA